MGRGPGPSLPFRSPPRVLPFIAPPPPSPIPAGPGFLTWSRLGLQLPDVPPPPAPTGHGPRPARPARSARAPSWRTWVSGARVPLSPVPPHRLDPLPHPGAPFALPASLHPCLLSSRFWSLPAPPFRLHVPLPASPFLPLPDWLLPPFFPRSTPPPLAADGWAGRRSACRRLGSGALGREELKAPWVQGLGK